MALIKCAECGKEISDKAVACPHCGCPALASEQSPTEKLAKEKQHKCKEKHTKKTIVILSIILAIIVLAILILTHTICLKHEYSDATVLEPQTCYFCGKTKGDPRDLMEIEFPTIGVGALLPTPASNMGQIKWEHSDSFNVYVGNTTREDYTAYIEACSDHGFNVDFQKNENSYYADDSYGNALDIWYRDNNIMQVQIIAPNNDTAEDRADDAEREPLNNSVELNNGENIDEELEFLGEIFSCINIEVLAARFPDEIKGYNDTQIESNFAGLNGEYKVCVLDNGDIWRVTFEHHEDVIDIANVVDRINASLGDYKEYDTEWNSYYWESNGFKIEFYADEKIYIDYEYTASESEYSDVSSDADRIKESASDDINAEAKDADSEIGVVENIQTAADIPNELMNDEFKDVIGLFSKGFSQSGLLKFKHMGNW